MPPPQPWQVIGPRGGVVTISADTYQLQWGDNGLTLAFTSDDPVAITIPGTTE